jgi:hypothetical protein
MPAWGQQLTVSSNDTVVENQIFDCSGSGDGIYVNTGLTGIKIYNVTIYNCVDGIELLSNAEITNVLFEGNTTDINENGGTATELTNYASATGDPLMIDPANSHFQLQSTSPVRGAGTDLGDTYDEDIAGNYHSDCGPEWDIGAFEFCVGRAAQYNEFGVEAGYSPYGGIIE